MKTCLLVDDSRVIRKIARQILETFGFACDEAEDGKVAFEFCQKNQPDMILLDWNMPVMSGIEFLTLLRKMPDGDKPVVVFCTTENDMPHIQEALAAGANEYIMKPFDSEILHDKLMQMNLISD